MNAIIAKFLAIFGKNAIISLIAKVIAEVFGKVIKVIVICLLILAIIIIIVQASGIYDIIGYLSTLIEPLCDNIKLLSKNLIEKEI